MVRKTIGVFGHYEVLVVHLASSFFDWPFYFKLDLSGIVQRENVFYKDVLCKVGQRAFLFKTLFFHSWEYMCLFWI